MDGELDLSWPPPPEPAAPQAPCPFALEFQAFCDELYQQLQTAPQARLERKIAETKLNIVDRYCDYLTDAPRGHVNAAGKKRHHCIGDVLNQTLTQIRRFQRLRLPPRFGPDEEPEDERPNPWGVRIRQP